MNSRLFLSLFFALSFFNIVQSQVISPRIYYAEPEREDNRRTNFEIIGKIASNFLVYKANRSDDAISVYDNEMKLKQRVKVNVTPEQLINVDFVPYADHFYMIYQYQKRNIVHCMAVKMDANAQPQFDPVELDTTQIGWATNNKIYTTINSDDRQKIMVFKINSKNVQNFFFTTLLFNNALQLQRKDRVSLPMEERNDFFTDFHLSNEGDLVFGKVIKQSGGDYINKAYMIIKYADSSSFSIKNIETGDRILDEIKLKVDNNNKRILFNSFYYKQKRSNIEGLYSVAWDKNAQTKIAETTTTFSDDLRASAKSSDANLKSAFNDYFIKNILIRKDGGYLLVNESLYNVSRGGSFNRWDYFGFGNPWLSPYDYYYYSPYYNSWNNPFFRGGGMGNSVTRYHAENIMVLSYDKDGKLEWSNIISKSQYDDESENLISYYMLNTGGEIQFLFNRLERKLLLLNNQSITPDGKLTRHPTLKNLDKGYDFMPRFAKQVSARQVIVPCMYRNYLCFTKIDF